MQSPSPTFNVTEFLDRRPFGRSHAIVLALCSLVTFLDGYDIYVVAYILLALATTFHVPPATLAPALILQQIGLTLGCYLVAPFADRFGRKNLIILCVAAFAMLTLATTRANSVEEFGMLRFCSGLFFGGALPNALAFINEVAPRTNRAVMTGTASAGISLSSAVGAVVSVALVREHGWQSVFLVGGLAPLAILPFLYWQLPESVRFLVTRNDRDPRIGTILRRYDRSLVLSGSERFILNEVVERRIPVAALFHRSRGMTTLLLWVGFFVMGFLLTVLGQFLPTFLQVAGGVDHTRASIYTGLYALAGALLQPLAGQVADRVGVRKVLILLYVVGGLALAAFGMVNTHSVVIYLMLLLLAATVQPEAGLSSTLGSWAYPTSIRATGLGWAWGASRVGAIVAPMIGGIVLAGQFSMIQIFLTISIASWIGAIAMWLIKPTAEVVLSKQDVMHAL